MNTFVQTEAVSARALDAVLKEGTVLTRDLGGQATTSEFADAIARRVVSA